MIKTFQDIQDAYAALLSLPLVIVDLEGGPITKLAGNSPGLKKIIMTNRLQIFRELKNKIEKIIALDKPMMIDIQLMDETIVKGILAPISSDGETPYYIFSGVFIEAGRSENLSELDEELIVPTLTNLEVHTQTELIAKMQNICEQLLHRHHLEEKTTLLSSCLSDDKKQLLQMIPSMNPSIDFIFYAKRKSENQFIIDEAFGTSGTKLKGLTVSSEYSFLEAVEAFIWDNVEFDPRVGLLVDNQVDPKLIFGVPILDRERIIGFLVGGSVQSNRLSPEAFHYIKYVSKLIELHQQNKTLEKNADRQLMRLSTLIEICKTMNYAKDMKDIVYILMDLANSLSSNQFIGVIVKDGFSDYQTSTSFNKEKIQDYFSELTSQYFTKEYDKSLLAIHLNEKMDGTYIECPIVFNKQILGVLSILITSQIDKELEVCLSSLVNFTASSLYPYLKTEKEEINNAKLNDEFLLQVISSSFATKLTKRELEILELVIKGYSNHKIGEQLYISNNTVKNHLTNIYRKLKVENRRQMLSTIYQLSLNY